jgi:hypothetical protein
MDNYIIAQISKIITILTIREPLLIKKITKTVFIHVASKKITIFMFRAGRILFKKKKNWVGSAHVFKVFIYE